MTLRSCLSRLVAFEGRQINVALDDGSRLDDCQLVSSGRQGAPSLWLVSAGADLFVPVDRVVEVWEAAGPGASVVLKVAE